VASPAVWASAVLSFPYHARSKSKEPPTLPPCQSDNHTPGIGFRFMRFAEKGVLYAKLHNVAIVEFIITTDHLAFELTAAPDASGF